MIPLLLNLPKDIKAQIDKVTEEYYEMKEEYIKGDQEKLAMEAMDIVCACINLISMTDDPDRYLENWATKMRDRHPDHKYWLDIINLEEAV